MKNRSTNTISVCLLLAITYSLLSSSVCNASNTTYYNNTLEFSASEIQVLLGDDAVFHLLLRDVVNTDIEVELKDDPPQIVAKPSGNILIKSGSNSSSDVRLEARSTGHTKISANSSLPYINTEDAIIEIRVFHSVALTTVSEVIGWIYFAAWTVSFYPQIYENFKRKSVEGLNFDYLALNFLGFTCYSIFNIGLFWIPTVQAEYKAKYPRSSNPVQPNDVGFSMHAVFATAITIIQVFMYKRGGQRVSYTCIGIMAVMMLFLIISLIVTLVNVMNWLDLLYFVSYVKLAITLMKYVPQAYHNFKRKSTEGWSIGNVLLDFTGGSLSILQMFFISYNFNDWDSIFGDPTKFGLGLFSVLFDILFVIQHYCLYKYSQSLSMQSLVPGPEA